jgi:hypothetical protein
MRRMSFCNERCNILYLAVVLVPALVVLAFMVLEVSAKAVLMLVLQVWQVRGHRQVHVLGQERGGGQQFKNLHHHPLLCERIFEQNKIQLIASR